MSKYIIEQDISEIGSANRDARREVSKLSNSVLSEMSNSLTEYCITKNKQHKAVVSNSLYLLLIKNRGGTI